MTKIFTHNGPRVYEATDVRMVVAKTRPDWMDTEWFEVAADEVEMEEYLAGESYPELKGLTKLWIEGFGETEVTRWGHV